MQRLIITSRPVPAAPLSVSNHHCPCTQIDRIEPFSRLGTAHLGSEVWSSSWFQTEFIGAPKCIQRGASWPTLALRSLRTAPGNKLTWRRVRPTQWRCSHRVVTTRQKLEALHARRLVEFWLARVPLSRPFTRSERISCRMAVHAVQSLRVPTPGFILSILTKVLEDWKATFHSDEHIGACGS